MSAPDRQSDVILGLLRLRGRPTLLSEMERFAGGPLRYGLDELVRAGRVEAVFPEAKPGDSGRQFWRLAKRRRPARAAGDDR